MDDTNSLSFEEVQARLANAETLASALEWLRGEFGDEEDTWDDAEARLAFAGVVVRHVELGVDVGQALRERARGWLEGEELDWESDRTRRELTRRKEIARLGG